MYDTLLYLKSVFMEICFEFICFSIEFKNVKIKRLFLFYFKTRNCLFLFDSKVFKR